MKFSNVSFSETMKFLQGFFFSLARETKWKVDFLGVDGPFICCFKFTRLRDAKINHNIFYLIHLFRSSVTDFHTNRGKLSEIQLDMQKLNLQHNENSCLSSKTI